MTGTRTRGGFVARTVEGVRGLFDGDGGTAADYVPTLVRRLFGDVLGYDDAAVDQRRGWAELAFRDDDGRPAVVLAATAPGEDVDRARRRAVAALAAEPTARYAVATNRDRLVVLARCSPGHADATTRRGVTTRELADIDLRGAIERSADRPLAEALTPPQQLAVATLTELGRDAVSTGLDDPERPAARLGAGEK